MTARGFAEAFAVLGVLVVVCLVVEVVALAITSF